MLLAQGRWQPLRLVAKHEHVASGKLRLQIARRRGLREQPGRSWRHSLDESGPVVDDFPLEMVPVIETRAAKVVIVEPKSQRSYEPQFATGRHAGAPDAA